MATIDELQQRLADLETEIRQFAPSGAAIPGFEQEYNQLSEEAAEIRRLLKQARESSAMAEEPAWDEDPTYHALFSQAEAAHRRWDWEVALASLEDARAFARGVSQVNAIEELIESINLERKEAEIAEIDSRTSFLLAEALDLAKHERFADALTVAQQAVDSARRERRIEVQNKRDDILRRQKDLAGILLEQLKTSIERNDLEEADILIEKLDRVDPDLSALIELRRKVNLAKQQQEIEAEIKRVENRLSELWASGLLRDARLATEDAKRAASRYPHVSQFHDFVAAATEKEAIASHNEQVWLTGLSLEQFSEVEAQLRARKKEGATELPEYEIREKIEDGKVKLHVIQKDNIAADAALDKLTQEIGKYSSSKAKRYREEAEQALLTDPKYALQIVTVAEQFVHLPDSDKRDLRGYRLAEIEPRVQLREQVDKTASEASLADDPIAGWKSLLSASEKDLAARSVKDAKQRLWPSVASRLKNDLIRCGEALTAGRWQEAEKQASDLRDLLDADDPNQQPFYTQTDELVQRAVRLQALKREIDAQTGEMERLITSELSRAEGMLRSTQKNVGDLASFFPVLANWRVDIEARKDLRVALQEIEEGYRDLSQPELEQRIARLRRLQQRVGETDDLKGSRERLELRRQFLMAQRLFEMGGGFRSEAEPILLELVARKAEDAATAQGFLDDIQNARLKTDQADRSLEDASRAAALQDFGKAIDLLKPWFDQPGELGVKIRAQAHSYERAWQKRLEGQLNAIKNNPRVAPLEQIEQRLDDLKRLAPSAGEEWQQKNMPGIYARAAVIAQRAGGSSLKTARELMDKAVQLTPNDDGLLQKRRVIAREQTRQQANSQRTRPKEQKAQGLSDAQSTWLKFLVEYEDDAEAWLELAQLSVDRGRYDEALDYLARAQDFDQAQSGAHQPSIGQLRATTEKLKDIHDTKTGVQTMLREDNQVSQYRSASKIVSALCQRQPDQTGEIEQWFTERKQELIRTLSARMKELPDSDPERWKLAVKIMTLDPQTTEAQTEISRAGANVRQLEIDTEALLEDFTGPSEIADAESRLKLVEPHRSLRIQIEKAEQLQSRAFDVSSLLDQQALSLGQAEGQQSAKACVEKINRRIKELKHLDRLVQQGRARLRGARGKVFSSGEWVQPSRMQQPVSFQSNRDSDPFESVGNILGDINSLDLPFSQHITVEALRKELVDAQKKRSEIAAMLKRLQQAVDDENFEAVFKLIVGIQESDADGQFEVIRNVRVYDPWQDENLPLVGASSNSNIEALTKARLAQWQVVDAWQKPMGLQDWRNDAPIPADCQRLGWKQHGESVCRGRWQQGLFTEAKKIIMDALGADNSEVASLDNRWSLRRCQKYLLDPRDSSGNLLAAVTDPKLALSKRVQQVVDARNEALKSVQTDIESLEGPRSDGELPLLERLPRDDANFYSYLDSIGSLLDELHKKRFGVFGLNSQQRRELCMELNQLIGAAKEIAPRYQGWDGILPDVQDNCSGR